MPDHATGDLWNGSDSMIIRHLWMRLFKCKHRNAYQPQNYISGMYKCPDCDTMTFSPAARKAVVAHIINATPAK